VHRNRDRVDTFGPVDARIGLRSLVSLLQETICAWHCFVSWTPETGKLTFTKCLGVGATSIVFAATYEAKSARESPLESPPEKQRRTNDDEHFSTTSTRQVAVKTPFAMRPSNEILEMVAKSFEHEKAVLDQLKEVNGVPKVLGCATFISNEQMDMVKTPKALILSMVGDRLPSDYEITSNDISVLLNSLRQVHELGWVHRDLRRENMLLIDGRLTLIDFGFAAKIGAPVPFAGALLLASKTLLAQLQEKEIGGEKYHTPRPADDLWSLVRMHVLRFFARQSTFNIEFSRLSNKSSIESIEAFWNNVDNAVDQLPEKSPIKIAIRSLQNAADTCDYDALALNWCCLP
jgi:serine/threonine protein kinase